MARERDEIIGLNIERYERLLTTETDPAKHGTLEKLLVEARDDALVAQAECRMRDGDDAEALRHDARRWTLQADEYSVLAKACRDDGARVTYLFIARRYELLAQQAKQRARVMADQRRRAG